MKDIYSNTTNFGKIICIDLDGVILKWEGFEGEDIFGFPVEGAISSMHELKKIGWYIIILTTRIITPHLIEHLNVLNIPFDDINGRVDSEGHIRFQTYLDRTSVDYRPHSPTHFWKHNPTHSSIKPIASVYVDDMSWENEGVNFDKEKWEKLIESLKRRFS